MKKSIKNLLIVCLICALCAGAGCGGNPQDSSDTGGTPQKGANNNTAADTEMEYFEGVPAELDGTTVKFATWIDHTRNESSQVLSDFTDITGIKVEIVTTTQSDYVSRLSALIAAGEAPDVIVNNSEWPIVLSLLQPLDGTILDTTDTFWDQDIVKMYTVGGRPYLVNVKGGAWDLGGACIVYNNRILEDNGITTPSLYYQEGRWNLDNFFKCARELKAVCPDGGVGIELSTFLNVYGKTFVSYNPEKQSFESNIASSDFVSLLQRLISARDSGYANVNDDGTRYLFEDEKIGMLFCGTYGLRKTGWFSSMDIDDIVFAPLPTLEAGSEQFYGVGGGRAYGISKGAKNADGAAYFLRYFLNLDHYDIDEVYKNEECAEFMAEIQENKICSPDVTSTVLKILVNPDKPIYQVFPDLKECTSAQVSTALNSGANTFNACVERANQMIQSAIDENS